MATIDLGKIRFNWQGAYNNSTAYVINDVVSSGGNSYICKLASTGNAVSNGTYWDLMSSAGTNGTDLTSTLTTQGDVLYRDGSGLQRLAKGTASQVLKMNSSANAPEWGADQGGSLNLISNTTLSSTSAVEYSSLDGDTYYQYLLVATGVAYSTSASLYLRFGDSSTINTGASYYYFYEKLYGGGGTGYSASAGASTTFIRLTEEQSAGGTNTSDGRYALHGAWYISGLNTTISSSTAGRTACVQGTYTNMASSGYLNGGNSFGSEQAIATRAVNRFQIYPSSGNFHSGFFSLYGISHS